MTIHAHGNATANNRLVGMTTENVTYFAKVKGLKKQSS